MENVFYQGSAEQPFNMEQRCPILLCVDRSGSMSGEPIHALNQGLQTFATEVQNDAICTNRLDIAIVSFGSDSTIERPFSLIGESPIPSIRVAGTTKLVDGVRAGIIELEKRKKYYKQQGLPYYRPYLVLITDGAPDADQNVNALAQEIRALASAKALNFWPIGVLGANMNVLSNLACSDINGSLPPLLLDGIKFKELFQWLSASFSAISASQDGASVNLAPAANANPFQMTI